MTNTTTTPPSGVVPAAPTRLGDPVNRIDGVAKVKGAARYSIDCVWPDMLHGYVITSTVAAGTVSAMATSAAENAPGVVAVYTPFNSLGIRPLPAATKPDGVNYAPLADNRIHHWGQVIGLVVAESFEQARDAAPLVVIQYDPDPAKTTLEAHADDTFVPDHIETGEAANVQFVANDGGTIDAAVADSDVVVRATYTTPAQNHAAMEPHGALAWWDEAGGLHIRTGHQAIPWLVRELAATFAVEPDSIDVNSTFVGGGFGGKTCVGVEAKLSCAAARVLKRPVRTVLTREQVFTATAIRSMTRQKMTLGARRDGTIVVVRHSSLAAEAEIVSDLLVAPGHLSSRMAYATENMEIRQLAVTRNLPRTGHMRGPAEVPGFFALETAMDELAVTLDIDPVQLRLHNDTSEFPGSRVPWTSKHLAECLIQGADRFGWTQRPSRPLTRLVSDEWVGLGVATTAYRAFRLMPADAEVGVRADGAITVASSAVDLGTGMGTVLAMAAADGMEVPISRVAVQYGDSGLPEGGAAIGSTGASSVGLAVHLATRELRHRLLERAVCDPSSPLYGYPRYEVMWADGAFQHRRTRLSVTDLLTALGEPEIVARGRAQSQPSLEPSHAHWSFGAQFAEVRVNRWTREPRVSRMLGVMDIGRVINRKTAVSQITGGMIWGLSTALLEGLVFDRDGMLTNGSFADYLIPVNADVEDVDAVLLDRPDFEHNEIGARGAGEISAVGMSAAIGNAVFNAVGVRVRDLPITLEKLSIEDVNYTP